MCVFVPSAGTRDHVDWRIKVKEVVAKIAKLRNAFFEGMNNFRVLKYLFWYCVKRLVPKDKNVCLCKPAYCAKGHIGGFSRESVKVLETGDG